MVSGRKGRFLLVGILRKNGEKRYSGALSKMFSIGWIEG
jgi:hypothetical protein